MAKITYGGLITSASGSMGGTVFSRNRYGPYIRRRAIPVNPDTSYQMEIRAILSAISQAWRGLTDDQRLQWRTWAANNPVTDTEGYTQTLAPNAAFVSCNHRLLQGGDPVLTAPPVIDAPDALTDLTVAAAAGLATCTIAFTPTPLAAGIKMMVFAAVVNSTGITYVKNLYKLTEISAAAAASPLDIHPDLVDRFGALIAGQVVHVKALTIDSATGLISPPASDDSVVAV